MTDDRNDQIREVQKARSRWTALLLLAFVVLIFGITLAKMGLAS